MKKSVVFALLMLFLLPLTQAEITLNSDGDYYNLGDKIGVEASVLPTLDLNGFFKVSIKCSQVSTPFFLAPVEMQKGFRTQVDVPPLTVVKEMLGKCSLRGELLSIQENVLEREDSAQFDVGDGLEILLLNENVSVLPGIALTIDGVVRDVEDLVEADIEYSFDDEKFSTKTLNGKFAMDFSIPEDIPSGEHLIKVWATDKYNNRGSGSLALEIIPTPTEIELSTKQQVVNPGEELQYTPIIYDQEGGEIEVAVEIRLTDPEGKLVFKHNVVSGEKQEYLLNQFAMPGSYVLHAFHNDISTSRSLKIKKIRNLNLQQRGSSIFLENTGNTRYEDTTTLIVEGAERNYVITKSVKLNPGEFLEVDLSKEVPEGSYDITLPKTSSILEGNKSSITKTKMLAENLHIQDHRPVIKKVENSLGGITGFIVGANGILVRSPWAAPGLLVFLITFLVIRYSPFRLFRRR